MDPKGSHKPRLFKILQRVSHETQSQRTRPCMQGSTPFNSRQLPSTPEAILQASDFLKEKFHWQTILTTPSDQDIGLISSIGDMFLD